MKEKNIVLVVAPSRKTKGGITSVLMSYEQSFLWKKWNCIWIETYIDKSALSKILYFIKGLVKFCIYLWSAEIIHIHLSESTSTIRKSFFFYISHLTKKKTIVHFHAFSIDNTINGKYKSLYYNIFKKSDKVIVLSQFWKNEIIRAFGDNVVDIEILVNPCLVLNKRKCEVFSNKYVLYAGALNSRKGFADLINAFSIVLRDHPDWNLILAGNGEVEQGRILANKLDISQHVIFTGWVSGEYKDKLFQEASIFCLPSYNEGFPMAVLDAISFGLPIITTPVGGILDVFTDGIDALIFNPGDIVSLSKKINMLIEDCQLRGKLIEASINLATTTFCLDSIVEKLDSIYSDLIKMK